MLDTTPIPETHDQLLDKLHLLMRAVDEDATEYGKLIFIQQLIESGNQKTLQMAEKLLGQAESRIQISPPRSVSTLEFFKQILAKAMEFVHQNENSRLKELALQLWEASNPKFLTVGALQKLRQCWLQFTEAYLEEEICHLKHS